MRHLILDRRSFLRGVLGGAAVSVALPPLEAMFDRNGVLLADGRPIPQRFGIWFFGNGVRRAHWIPTAIGSDWTAKAEMEPLTAMPGLKPYLTPLTGFEVKVTGQPHHTGMNAIMTGSKYFTIGPVRDTIISTFAQPSIDQVIAERWASDPATRTPFRSLELGVCRFRGSDEGTTFQHLSHNGPNNVNPAEYDPLRLFNRLFGMPLSAQKAAARKSVLDAVRGDVLALKQRVGTPDKLRLDQHLESIRSIELRLSTGPSMCRTPERPLDSYPEPMGHEPIQEKNEILSDILAMALACDLTRVFSVLFSTCGAGTVFWQVGATLGLHPIAHNERDPGPELQPTLHAATVFTMKQLAYFLNRLRSTAEGAGNLLDSSAILCTTELSEGATHTNDEFPIILAGKAGGALKTGFHHRSTTRETSTKVLLTLLRALGDRRQSFGVDVAQTSEVVPALLI